MDKTIRVAIPPGATEVLVTVYERSDDAPSGWEEVAVRSHPCDLWCPVELTAGGFEVQDERGTVIRSSSSEAA